MVMIRSEQIHGLLLLVLLFFITLPAGAETTPPTLQDLKDEGARRSIFITQTEQPIQTEAPEPALDRFNEEIQPILENHCVRCHGPKKAKGRLRIDTLNPNLIQGDDVDWWLDIQGALGKGEMPPPDESELTGEDRGKVMEWLSGEIRLASITRRASGKHSSFRRMTRYEYNYALQDLLGLPWNFARDLPPEAHSEDGFQNSSETLSMSVAQMETYRRIARKALDRATVSGPQPPALYWGISMEQAGQVEWQKQTERMNNVRDQFKDDPEKQAEELDRLNSEFLKPHSQTYFKDLSTGWSALHTWDYGGARYAFKPTDSQPEVPETFEHVAIIPQGRNQRLILELGDKLPDEGILRVRVRASGIIEEAGKFPSMQLQFGWQASNEGRALLTVSEADIPVMTGPDNPQFYQWDVILGDIYPRNSVRKTSPLGSTPSPSEYIRIANSSESTGEIQIDYVEIIAPVFDQWPPEWRQRIFFNSANQQNEPVYAREILSAFMPRAWRRIIDEEEIDQKLRLFHRMREFSNTFEEAMVEVLATVLSSPNFLYIVRDAVAENTEAPSGTTKVSDHELATRLSMFLWCSVPDDQLLKLADCGRLSCPEVLEEEVRRMLLDSRSERFANQFVHQWLDMQLLDFLKPEGPLDIALKEAMQLEPVLFFQETLSRNESVLNFIHADFTMANERLARHYGLTDVYGNHFRRIALDPERQRGGLLTQAGLLAMNSSGKDSNPLKRGIWLLESLLNDPPPPPPPAVPIIDLTDPEIAKMTLKERIEDHRNQPACMSCHVKIDPWGIALENYDALGLWREQVNGKPVDSTSRLFNNESLDGMDGLKRFLLKNRQDQFVRALTHKMMVYALGRPLTFADQNGVEVIAAKVRQHGDGLATMVQQITSSELFLSK